MLKDYYRLSEVATALGLQVRTIRKYIHNGKLKGYKTESNHWVIPKAEVDRLKEEMQDGKTGE